MIGPNGCGKSNISDALRWVLGEQRPSAIRGARMEEAIFQGTERRKPIHRAEVTLVLSNEDARLPVPYAEVRIARTLFRGGESEYALNGAPCRLRDILDLCRDTGLGADAYSVIENRMVDSILSDRAEERRAMFEEAAGIGRYKERRRVAARRLDEAEQDLARLSDVVSEVETKVRSLAQQRGRARRHHELQSRKLSLEIALADRELAALSEAEARIAKELEALRDTEAGEGSALRSGEAEYERRKVEAAELDRRRAEAGRRLQERRDRIAEREQARARAEERIRNGRLRLDQIGRELQEIDTQRAQWEAELGSLRARESAAAERVEEHRGRLQEAEARLNDWEARRRAAEGRREELERARSARTERQAALRGERDSTAARARELASAVESVDAELRSLEEDLEEAGHRLEADRGQLSGLRRAIQELEAQLKEARAAEAQARAREQDARTRLATLSGRLSSAESRHGELEAQESGGGSGNPAVRALLEARGALPGVRGLLVDSLQAPDDLATALESFLGDYLEAVVVDGAETVRVVRRWFRAEYRGTGGVCLLPLDAVRGEPVKLPPPLRAEGPGAPWLARLLHGVRVESGELAAPPAPPAPGAPALSEEGESVDRLGAVRIGHTGAASHRLSRRLEVERLAREIESLRTTVEQAQAEVSRAADALAFAASRIHELEARRRTQITDLGRGEGEVRALETRRADLAQERERLEGRRQTVERERLQVTQHLGALESEIQSLRARPAAKAAEPPTDLPEIQVEWEKAHERVTGLRVEEARLSAELANRSHELAAANRRLQEWTARAGALASERAAPPPRGRRAPPTPSGWRPFSRNGRRRRPPSRSWTASPRRCAGGSLSWTAHSARRSGPCASSRSSDTHSSSSARSVPVLRPGSASGSRRNGASPWTRSGRGSSRRRATPRRCAWSSPR